MLYIFKIFLFVNYFLFLTALFQAGFVYKTAQKAKGCIVNCCIIPADANSRRTPKIIRPTGKGKIKLSGYDFNKAYHTTKTPNFLRVFMNLLAKILNAISG